MSEARDARGRKIKVHLLPQPGPLHLNEQDVQGLDQLNTGNQRRAGDRLAASYINFYIGNSVVIAPLLDKRHDAAVLAKLRRWFPKRKVVGVPAREILLGGGGIHCITQQIPR